MMELDAFLDGFLAKIAPAGRKALAATIAKRLRESQQDRIAAQQNPDGSAYAPRKPQLRSKKGSIRRRAMFAKLRTARFMKARATAEAASVSIGGSASRIARVHQYGLADTLRNRGRAGPTVQYPARELLGFSAADVELVKDLVLEHLAG